MSKIVNITFCMEVLFLFFVNFSFVLTIFSFLFFKFFNNFLKYTYFLCQFEIQHGWWFFNIFVLFKFHSIKSLILFFVSTCFSSSQFHLFLLLSSRLFFSFHFVSLASHLLIREMIFIKKKTKTIFFPLLKKQNKKLI